METPPRPPGLFRRLSAMFYDALLLFGVLYFAAALVLLLTRFVFADNLVPDNPFFRLYLIGVSFFYFGWFWTHGGQTLGMKAWRIRLTRCDGGRVTWKDALIRFVAALISWLPAGLGYLWILLDRERRAWHDRLSATAVVGVSKK
jgi:uncharacterized RDD family membrane protein YckC